MSSPFRKRGYHQINKLTHWLWFRYCSREYLFEGIGSLCAMTGVSLKELQPYPAGIKAN